MKLLKENIEENLQDIEWTGQVFLSNSPWAQATKAKMDKWDHIKLKNSAQLRKQQSEETNHRSILMGENICKLPIWQGINNQNV